VGITPANGAAEVGAEDLLGAAIPVVRRGYAAEVVDELLERAAATIRRLSALDEPDLEQARRDQADLLHRTLLLAQTSADRRLADAESTAAALLAEAEGRATRLVADAERVASNLLEAERTRAELTLGEAMSQRALLRQEIEALERFASQLRDQLREVFDENVTGLDRLLATARGDRPAPREIDLTDPGFARSLAGPVDDGVDWAARRQEPTRLSRLVPDAAGRTA
jgi:hypothetical protein